MDEGGQSEMCERAYRCPQCEVMMITEPVARGPRCSRCLLIMLDVGELEDLWSELEGRVDDGSEGDPSHDLSATD